jgi:hypothetical protein
MHGLVMADRLDGECSVGERLADETFAAERIDYWVVALAVRVRYFQLSMVSSQLHLTVVQVEFVDPIECPLCFPRQVPKSRLEIELHTFSSTKRLLLPSSVC